MNLQKASLSSFSQKLGNQLALRNRNGGVSKQATNMDISVAEQEEFKSFCLPESASQEYSNLQESVE